MINFSHFYFQYHHNVVIKLLFNSFIVSFEQEAFTQLIHNIFSIFLSLHNCCHIHIFQTAERVLNTHGNEFFDLRPPQFQTLLPLLDLIEKGNRAITKNEMK